MSHEVETMMYTGSEPWHHLGKEVAGLQTSSEAIIAAGLDWDVEMVPITVGKDSEPSKNFQAIRRVTDGKVYAVVGKRYSPVQNRDAFQFFDSVVREKSAIYETAGSLKGGSVVWILANLGDPLSIKGEEVRRYVTLANTHDGTGALKMFWTPIRVVCWNTLSMALSGAKDTFYARHTESIKGRVEEAQVLLSMADKFYGKFREQAEYLSAKLLPEPQRVPLLMAAFKQPDSIRMEDVYSPVKIQMRRAIELIEIGRGNDNPDIRGTAWQAYQGIAQFIDYEKRVKGSSLSSPLAERRLHSAWFGAGKEVKERAWNWLLKY